MSELSPTIPLHETPHSESLKTTSKAKRALIALGAVLAAGAAAVGGVELAQHPDFFANAGSGIMNTLQKIGGGIQDWFGKATNSDIVHNVENAGQSAINATGKFVGEVGGVAHDTVSPFVNGFQKGWANPDVRKAMVAEGTAGVLLAGAGFGLGHKKKSKS